MTKEKSLLEQMIETASTTPHPSPIPAEESPFYEGEWFHAGRAAVQTLSEEADIKEFMGQYVSHISTKYGLSADEAQQSANRTVGWSTGFVDDDQANMWYDALPNISHPILGRERPYQGGDSFYVIPSNSDSRVVDFLKDRLVDNVFMGMYTPEFTPPSEGSPYAVFKMTPASGVPKENVLSLISGVAHATEEIMKRDFGLDVTISIESPKKYQ